MANVRTLLYLQDLALALDDSPTSHQVQMGGLKERNKVGKEKGLPPRKTKAAVHDPLHIDLVAQAKPEYFPVTPVCYRVDPVASAKTNDINLAAFPPLPDLTEGGPRDTRYAEPVPTATQEEPAAGQTMMAWLEAQKAKGVPQVVHVDGRGDRVEAPESQKEAAPQVVHTSTPPTRAADCKQASTVIATTAPTNRAEYSPELPPFPRTQSNDGAKGNRQKRYAHEH